MKTYRKRFSYRLEYSEEEYSDGEGGYIDSVYIDIEEGDWEEDLND